MDIKERIDNLTEAEAKAEIEVVRPDFEETYTERELWEKVERWCFWHYDDDNPCDCPFFNQDNYSECKFGSTPTWSWLILKKFLRTRGLKDY